MPKVKRNRPRFNGDLLRRLRRQAGWTLEEVAERTGRALSTIAVIETGINQPNPKTMGALCRLFNVPEEFFYGKYEGVRG